MRFISGLVVVVAGTGDLLGVWAAPRRHFKGHHHDGEGDSTDVSFTSTDIDLTTGWSTPSLTVSDAPTETVDSSSAVDVTSTDWAPTSTALTSPSTWTSSEVDVSSTGWATSTDTWTSSEVDVSSSEWATTSTETWTSSEVDASSTEWATTSTDLTSIWTSTSTSPLPEPTADGGAPHFVIYTDATTSYSPSPPPASALEGYNVFTLSFLLTSNAGGGIWASDAASDWTSLDDYTRAAIKADYAQAGIKIIVSVFGSTDMPTTNGVDPLGAAQGVAEWVQQWGVDGVDVDWEDLGAMNAGDGQAEAWIIAFTQQLRSLLPEGHYILTHAPLAPWFSPGMYGGGGYLKVNEVVGNLIDWYNIQFYNQGANEYTSCSSLLYQSQAFPSTSVFEIAASGVALEKIVIGKPGSWSDATNGGMMDVATLGGCAEEAKGQGWNAGVMVWEYADGMASWIESVREEVWPLAAS